MFLRPRIKKVNKNNFLSLVKLIKELAKYEKLPPPDDNAVKRLEKDCLSNKKYPEVYLAYYKCKPVGYMILLLNYSSFLALPTLYIEDLFVLKKYRRNVIGQAMFNYAKS